jgi:ABC-type branched-subunit amino acid transport system permease subunit
MTIFGVILILIILFLPNGIVGDFRKLLKPFKRKSEASL